MTTMSEFLPMNNTTSPKEAEGDFVNIEIKGKGENSASLKTPCSVEALVESNLSERRNSNSAVNEGIFRHTTTTTGTPLVTYKLYKRRWIGLIQLVLLNILFGWNWQMLFPITERVAQYFHTSATAKYTLSFSYTSTICMLSPLAVWVIHRYGCRPAFIIAGLALAFGSLMQYIGALCAKFQVVLLANLIMGTGASFSMIVPTHYSDLWFSPTGRMGATALATLAFPVGSGIGQLVSPMAGPTAQSFPSMTLVISMVSIIVSLGSFFVTAKPPTQASASRTVPKMPLFPAFVLLIRSKAFWLLSIPFAVCWGLASAKSFIFDEMFTMYDEYAWVCRAVFIGTGLITGCILPIIIARYNISLVIIKTLCPIVGLCHLAFIWVPSFSTPLVPLFLAAILGGASFSLLPIILEYLVDILHPIAPENTSSLSLVAGLSLGAWYIGMAGIISAHDTEDSTTSSRNSLILQAVFGLLIVPLPFCLSTRSTKVHVERR